MVQVFIDKDKWLDGCGTLNEQNILREFVKTGWYGKKAYTKLIDDMKNKARSIGDSNTWYIMSQYLDFDQLAEELFWTDESLVKNYKVF